MCLLIPQNKYYNHSTVLQAYLITCTEAFEGCFRNNHKQHIDMVFQHVCVLINWLCKDLEWKHSLPQTSHLYGLSQVCFILCICKLYEWPKCSPDIIFKWFFTCMYPYTSGFSPAIWRGAKMHSLIYKCNKMCSLIEDALLNLLHLPLNYLSKHSLYPTAYMSYSDVGGVISSFYTFNAQICQTWHVKICSLKKTWGEPWEAVTQKVSNFAFVSHRIALGLNVYFHKWISAVACPSGRVFTLCLGGRVKPKI